MRTILVLSAFLVGSLPAAAQPLDGRWTVSGRDRTGPYRGRATLTPGADGSVEARLDLEYQRVTATGALALTGRRAQAQVTGRLVGARLRGLRRVTTGLAGALSGGGGAPLLVSYRLERAGAQRRLAGGGPGVDELLCQEGPAAARADELRPGDWGAPLEVASLPFTHASSTVARRSLAQRYSARAEADESGPEVVYRVQVATRSRLTAWVRGDGVPTSDPAVKVDVDVHVLSSLALDAAGLATACLARDDVACTLDLDPGAYFVVVDTFRGAARAGGYTLRIDVEPDDAWYARPIARGVTLRTKRYVNGLYGAPQTGSVLDVDLHAPGVEVKPLVAQGCLRTSELARRAGAAAAINGGFFDTTGGCRSVSFAKVDGDLRAPNVRDRSAIGFDADGRPEIDLVPAGQDVARWRHGLGGVGRLLPALTQGEGAGGSFSTTRHPRTAVGITPSGDLVLATVDGRTAAGAGMRLEELARWLRDLGCRDALNLDGGGSTTLWARGEPFGGVVNYPSDDRRPDHLGERAVSTALAVFAPPLDRDAVWLGDAAAPATVAPGARFVHEVVAADPEGARVSFRLEGAPAGMELLDRGDGTARLAWIGAWPEGGPATVTVRVVALIEDSRPVTRTLTLRR